MKLIRKIDFARTVLMVGGALLLLTACGDTGSHTGELNGKVPASNESLTTVSALQLSLNSAYSSRSFYTGRVEASRSSDLGFELGGLLRAIEVDEGDRVSAGQVLASLDTDRLEAQYRESEAGVAQARAQAGLAQSTLDRLLEAREFDGVSQQQLDEATNAAATSRAAVLAAESRLARVRVDVDKARLTAPYDAVILNRHHDEGQVLSPGQPVLSIQDTHRLEVRIGIVGSVTQQLELGGTYTLLVRGQPVVATLRSILPVRDAVTRTVDAIFAVDLEDGNRVQIHAGDLAELELRRTIDAEGYWVPLTALAEGERGLWNAYALVPADPTQPGSTYIVQSRAVEVLYQDGSRAFINGALRPDERIVPAGLNRIVPGQRVNLASEGV